ncbi:MAG: hypothetical protein NVS2B9_10600 [Myxococcales bacterium]
MTQKIDRKELRKPDEFQVRAGHAMEWAAANQRKLAVAIAALLAVVLLAWGASAYKSSREAKGGAALSEALEQQSRPLAGEGQATTGTETFATKEDRQKAVIAALEKVRGSHAGTLAAQTAQAELGFQKMKSGDAAGAQKELQEFLDKAGKGHPLRPFAIESLGYAFEDQKKLDEARATFAKLAEAGEPARAAFQSARLSLAEGKPEAKAQLEQVAKDYPKDPVASEAQQRLELAALPKSEPGQPEKAPPAPPSDPKAGPRKSNANPAKDKPPKPATAANGAPPAKTK